jgi:transposase
LAHPDLHRGFAPWPVAAPWVLGGPINDESFRLDVERILVPTLRAGAVVVLDNLGRHKQVCVRLQIHKIGAHLFFRPAYSPDLKPIEQMFAKLKHLLRKA